MRNRKKRYRDVVSVGPSKSTEHLRNAPGCIRHRERLRIAYSCRHDAMLRVKEMGLVLAVNEQHWRVYFPDSTGSSPLVEWWPSTAKCVIFQRWGKGLHVHNAGQFLEITKRLVHGGVVIDGHPVSYAKCAHAIATLNPSEFVLREAQP